MNFSGILNASKENTIDLYMLSDFSFDTFMHFLTFLPKNKCAVCSNRIFAWETPYLTIHCKYNDSRKNGTYLFCCLECSAHANLPQRVKMIKS